ncbi:MAG: hypothetical protein QOK15_3636, partial [Nocardioidaceae bacterium]|nr:hypothetical protein [Nocardioidaceae bacterium]
MARTRFRSDSGLTIRMTAVMLLLGALYVTVAAGLIVYGFSAAVVLIFAALAGVGQWYFSDKLAMMAMRA